MSFAKSLNELLKERNISQSELAKRIGFSQRAVSKWIRGESEPSETAIIACAKFFGTTTDEILSFNEDGTNDIKNTIYLSSKEDRFLKLFKSLSFSNQQILISYLEFLKQKE